MHLCESSESITMKAAIEKRYTCLLITAFIISIQPDFYACLKKDGTDNPDIYMKAPGIIRRHGYVSETHTFLTEDGYFIGIHRIPFKQNEKPNRKLQKPIIFLQHGLLSSSADWLITGPGKSLAFLLADQGYDVWLGNVRGNSYALEHINLTTSKNEFWDFSYDEYALHDLPGAVKHILARTGQPSLTVISHSLGGAAAIAMVASFPEFIKKINLMICMAPPVYGTHMTSPVRLIYSNPNRLKFTSSIIASHNPALIDGDINGVTSHVCTVNEKTEKLCENILFFMGGYDKTNLNASLIPVISTHFPSSTGGRVALQLAQHQNSGRFCKFDYGKKGNQKLYHSNVAPLYPLEKVKVPTAIIYAKNDWLVNYKDAEKLIKNLPNVIKKYVVPDKNFTHFDYYYATNAPKIVYTEIFKILEDNLDVTPRSFYQNKKRQFLKDIRWFTNIFY